MTRWVSVIMVSLKDGEKMKLKDDERLVFDEFDSDSRLVWFALIREWDE